MRDEQNRRSIFAEITAGGRKLRRSMWARPFCQAAIT
jgi:DNA-binding MarR family transcriptional regulator